MLKWQAIQKYLYDERVYRCMQELSLSFGNKALFSVVFSMSMR